MKNFLIKLLLYTVPILLIIFTIESIYHRFPNLYSFKKAILDIEKDKTEILVIGPSYTFRGVDPGALSKKAFNLSFPGQSFEHDKILLDYYLEDMDNLEWVILSVSYLDLLANKNRISYRDIYYRKHFSPFSLNLYLEELNGMRLYRAIRDYLKTGRIQIGSDSLGFRFTKNIMSPDARFKMRYKTASKETKLNNKKLLEEMIMMCRSRDVNVILLSTPMIDRYLELTDLKPFSEIIDLCESLDSTYSNTFYLNYIDSSKFDWIHFSEPSHLNHSGATLLTQDIDAFIRNLHLTTD